VVALRRPHHGRVAVGVRTDIQALRALAVGAVVLYHLWPTTLSGGFVGVDVFFVISGFLITGQLTGELARTGRISLTRFWARRIRRLLPPAFAVLTASFTMLVLLMPRVTWQHNLEEIRAASAYFENWLLGVHAVDYLAAEDSASLVQHYWSLSVEEQFYLAWPLLLLLTAGVSRIRPRIPQRRFVCVALVVAAAASFVESLRLTAAEPPFAFFATPARAWEFAVGGLVALTAPARSGARAGVIRAGLRWSGAAVIGYSVFAISAKDPFPGSIALVPVAGAALVLAAGMPSPRSWSARLLDLRAIQWVGDNSYSIYLWHWPLIVAAPWVLHHPLTWTAKTAMLVASLLLAGATRRFVEDPVRTGRRWSARLPAYGFAVVALVALVGATSISYVQVQRSDAAAAARAAAQARTRSALVPRAHLLGPTGGTGTKSDGRGRSRARPQAPVSCYGAAAMINADRCPRPYARPADLNTAFAATDGRTYECLQDTGASTPQFCTFGHTENPTRTIAVVGNSHARRLIPALDLYGRQHGWRIILAAKIDCMGLIPTPIGTLGSGDSCVWWSSAVQRNLLAMPGLDAVIFASHIDAKLYLTGPGATSSDVALARQRVLATWSTFVRRGIRVLVAEDVPGMRPDSDPECIAMSSKSYDPCAVRRAAVVRPNLLTTLAQDHPGLVRYLRLTKYFCDADSCHGLIGGVVVYFDSHHLTATYSRTLAPYLGADVNAAFAVRS
jgi:peptidoglycan/LPS O-acetylase OafA/YrhL